MTAISYPEQGESKSDSESAKKEQSRGEKEKSATELARQSLVGGAVIAFDEELESLPLEEKSHRVREQFKKQIQGEPALYSFAALRGLTKMILEKPTDDERQAFAQEVRKYANRSVSGTVSYVGKSDFGGRTPISRTPSP